MFYVITDHQFFGHGGCYIQEACERPCLLTDRSEAGVCVLLLIHTCIDAYSLTNLI